MSVQPQVEPVPVEATVQTVPLDLPSRRAEAKAVPDVSAAQTVGGLATIEDELEPAVVTETVEVEPFRLVGVSWGGGLRATEH